MLIYNYKMNRKYDYMDILSKTSTKEFDVFRIAFTNDEDFAYKIFEAIKLNVPGISDLYLRNPRFFIEFLLGTSHIQQLTRLEVYLLNSIRLNKNFYNNLNYDSAPHLINIIVGSWLNKTKTLKTNVNQLQMIYYNFMEFSVSDAGQDLLYASSVFSPDITAIPDDREVPFYESYAYRVLQVKKCKKIVLKHFTKTALENCIVRYIWDEIFEGSNNNKNIIKKVHENISEKYLTDSRLYQLIRKYKVDLLEVLLDGSYLEDYFDLSRTYMIDGKVHNLRTAMEQFLLTASLDYEEHKYYKLSAAKITEVVENWSRSNGIRYSDCQSSDALIACKVDSNLNTHKTPKLYFYKNGVVKDFYTGQSFNVKKFIPQEYWS